jgi:hypothetical protein
MTAASESQVPDSVIGCLEACRRCKAVVAAVIEREPRAFSAVGPHLRHCVEHFKLLLDGWRSGFVDYDARARDPRLERDPWAVLAALEDITGSLSTIQRENLHDELVVSQSAAPGRPPASSGTRLERELLFLSGHAIHHIAIMVLAASAAGVAIPSELAVAYSTAGHRESLAVNG